VAAAVSAITGAVKGVVTLWEQFFPPAPPVSATIVPLENVVLNQRFRQHLRAHPEAAPGRTFTAAQQDTNGVVYTIKLHLEGLEGETATLSWRTFDGNTKQPLPQPPWVPDAEQLRPRSDDVRLTREIWVAIPLRGESLFVRFTVTRRGTPPDVIEQADSRPPIPIAQG
jgi:hypothetical protein